MDAVDVQVYIVVTGGPDAFKVVAGDGLSRDVYLFGSLDGVTDLIKRRLCK